MTTQHPKALLVIVAEAVIERTLLRDARAMGVQTWTVSDVRGGSREGEREGAWEADRTVELKFVCDADVADAIAEHVLTTYAPNYGVVIYFSGVSVLRPERY